MQTTVIMYTEGIKKAARESCEHGGDDAMSRISAYIDALEEKIKEQGYNVERRDKAVLSPERCFGVRCDEDEALDYCRDLPSYWEWL